MRENPAWWVRVGIMAALLPLAGAAAVSPATLNEAEETYELRLERVLHAKGHRGLIAHLARELQERPRPYVKAWYANYLLYGAEFGVKDVADPQRGFALAEEAAKEGSLYGLELVGRACGDGRGTTKDVEKALGYLRRAAEQDRHTAMIELGKYYFFGQGVPKDRALAEGWMRKAAWRGATAGLMYLAEWWETARYLGVKPDLLKSQALYYEVGEHGARPARTLLADRAKRGDSDAQKYVHLDLVVSALRGYDALPTQLRAAVKWLEANCAADDWQVQLALANAMKERLLVVYNPDAAREKATRAAAAGHDDARALLADMAWRGIGQKADPQAAVEAWQDLARKGNAIALNQLGWLHWWGNGEKFGVPKDAAKAYTFCRQSADLGYWAGQLNVAECYAHGIGVTTNYYLAAKYYGILEDRRYKNAHRMKERILALVKD